MKNGSYTQMTIKFPMNRERFCQAVDCIENRDRSRFRTQAEYLTAAILFFEGKLADDQTSLQQIFMKVQEIDEKVEMLRNEKEKNW